MKGQTKKKRGTTDMVKLTPFLSIELGKFINCTITDSREYDLIAEIRN